MSGRALAPLDQYGCKVEGPDYGNTVDVTLCVLHIYRLDHYHYAILISNKMLILKKQKYSV